MIDLIFLKVMIKFNPGGKRTEEELQELDIEFALMEHTAEKIQNKIAAVDK